MRYRVCKLHTTVPASIALLKSNIFVAGIAAKSAAPQGECAMPNTKIAPHKQMQNMTLVFLHECDTMLLHLQQHLRSRLQ